MPSLRQWFVQLDRERIVAFFRFLLGRFIDDRCFETAGALAFTTMFALVPLTAVVMSVLSAFPAFDPWTAQLTDFIFLNFIPDAARGAESYLREFAQSARQLTASGIAVLVISLLVTMWSIERTFNRIWRVASARPRLIRFLLYWTLLTLGSLLLAALLAATSALFALPALSGVESMDVTERLLRYLPTLVEFVAFTLAYWLIPHRVVPLRFALAGSALATCLFEWQNRGVAVYFQNASFEQLYGTLAVVPILLFWVYASWLVILLGASFAASLSAFRYQPRATRLVPGTELYGVLRLLAQLQLARRTGQGLRVEKIQQLEPSLTDDLLQHMLTSLSDMHIVTCSQAGDWLLSRDLDTVPLAELYEGMDLRMSSLDLPLPGRNDLIGRAAANAMQHLRQPLHDSLQHSVASFLTPHLES